MVSCFYAIQTTEFDSSQPHDQSICSHPLPAPKLKLLLNGYYYQFQQYYITHILTLLSRKDINQLVTSDSDKQLLILAVTYLKPKVSKNKSLPGKVAELSS
jgi:hypothetical protein